MPRRPVTRSLPDPAAIFRSFARSPGKPASRRVLVDTIRSAALSLRSAKPRPFYSVRALAAFFKVSLSAISAVYGQLEKEGILDRVHGSRTILAGVSLNLDRRLRAVIGFPMALPVLLISRPGRAMWLHLTERLSTTGYAVDLIVHGSREHLKPGFVDRIIQHAPDVLLWCWPTASSSCRENIASVRRHGIRCITVQTAGLDMALPSVNYLEDCRPAYDRLAACWKQSGIKKVLIPVHPDFRVEAGFRKLLGLSLARAGLESVPSPLSLEDLVKYCARRRGLAVAFLNRSYAERAALARPGLMESLMRSARVGLCRGSISSSILRASDVRADVVDSDLRELADAIVQDVPHLTSLPNLTRRTFFSRFLEWQKIDPLHELADNVLPSLVQKTL